ncbi:MAG TPA: lysozyme [Terracidiphilus sp.]|nr:lysozyme [Terracidiphilus sp.]
MKTSDAGLALIKRFEGLILGAYDDEDDHIVRPGERVYGTLTIGYGHTSVAGPPRVYVGQEITEEQADAILAADLASVEIEVGHLVKVPLSQTQFDALVDFQFNTGWLGHSHSSILAALNAGNYRLADEDFMLYDRAQGKVITGLCRRRAAERDLFNGGSDEHQSASINRS